MRAVVCEGAHDASEPPTDDSDGPRRALLGSSYGRNEWASSSVPTYVFAVGAGGLPGLDGFLVGETTLGRPLGHMSVLSPTAE